MGQAFSGVKRSGYLLLAGVMLAVLPGVAGAVGLGQLKVKSALNEPLNAEIPLTSVTRREIRSLEAGMAPRGAFDALGIDRPGHLSDIKFNVAKRLDGSYFLQLTTRLPYQEPFLHMLVQVEWAGGRLRREYTALIDPPYLSSARPSSITAPRIQAPAADYEPLPEPITDEVLKESTAPEAPASTPEKLPEPVESLPAPLPEEPTLINKQADGDRAEVETAPALPEPMAEEPPVAAKSIDQIEAEAFGTAMPEPAADTGTEPVMEPMPEPEQSVAEVDRREGLLGPPHIPIIDVEPTPYTPMEPATTSAATESVMEAESIADSQFASDQYKVKRGDTLYEIAQRMRNDSGVTLNQLMMAIYEANPRAFYNNNVNNLRSGRILQIPEVDTVRRLPNAQATRQFRAHYDTWQEHKLQLAQSRSPVRVAPESRSGQAAQAKAEARAQQQQAKAAKAKAAAEAKKQAEAKAKAEAEAKQQAQAKAKAAAEARKQAQAKAKAAAEAKKQAQAKAKAAAEAKKQAQAKKAPAKPAPSKTAKARQTEDLLRIVRASMLVAPNDAAQVAETESQQAEKERQILAKRMNNLEESAESAKLQNKEIGDKVGKVQKNIESQKRLIEIENPSLAKGEPAKQPVAKTDKPAAKKPAANKPAKVAKPQKPVRRPAPTPQTKEIGIVDTVKELLLGNQFILMMLGGVVLLGTAIMAIYMKRRRKSLADFEESILSADTTTDDLSTDSQDDIGDSGDTSFLSDFSQEGMGNIATDEVDPIAEADVYLAYGRDEQAEEILKDAISKNSDRAEVKLKLLEIYHQRNDVSAFETLAEELYASGNAGDAWPKVAEMGAQLNAENPMFQGDGPPAGMMGAGAPAAEPMMGGDLDMMEMAPGDAVLDDGSGMDDSLDFDIDSPVAGDATQIVSPPSGAEAPASDAGSESVGGGLDFNLDFDDSPKAETEEPSGEDSDAGEGDFALDFNMDTADVGGDDDAPAEQSLASSGDDGGLDFNMDFEVSDSDSGDSEDDSSGLSMDDDAGLSFDMDDDDDSSLSMESTDDSDLSLDMGLDDSGMESGDGDELDFSAMESEQGDDDLSALDMVQAAGGGLPENEDGSLDFSLSSDTDEEDNFGLGEDDSDLDLTTEFGSDSSVASAVDVSEAIGTAEADVDADDNWDEAATKLDLAKAYIDMGDADGAKSILDEVMAEGNDEQKAQASELAAQI